jgi:hypothetical protein
VRPIIQGGWESTRETPPFVRQVLDSFELVPTTEPPIAATTASPDTTSSLPQQPQSPLQQQIRNNNTSTIDINGTRATFTTSLQQQQGEQEENATITFVLLTRINPDGSGSGTSVTYFSTNSTGQLAFLDNLVAIGQVEYSPAEGINCFAEWEWKGGMLPFENLLPQS